MFLKHFSLKRSIDWLAILIKHAVRARLLFSFWLHSRVQTNAKKERKHKENYTEFKFDSNCVKSCPNEEINQPGAVREPWTRMRYFIYIDNIRVSCHRLIIIIKNIRLLGIILSVPITFHYQPNHTSISTVDSSNFCDVFIDNILRNFSLKFWTFSARLFRNR